jgi:hypothetical protein
VHYDVQWIEAAYQTDVSENKTSEAGWKYDLPEITGLELTLVGLVDGSYQARWYSPETGQWLAEQTIQVQDGVSILAIPSFSTDLALKVERSR